MRWSIFLVKKMANAIEIGNSNNRHCMRPPLLFSRRRFSAGQQRFLVLVCNLCVIFLAAEWFSCARDARRSQMAFRSGAVAVG